MKRRVILSMSKCRMYVTALMAWPPLAMMVGAAAASSLSLYLCQNWFLCFLAPATGMPYTCHALWIWEPMLCNLLLATTITNYDTIFYLATVGDQILKTTCNLAQLHIAYIYINIPRGYRSLTTILQISSNRLREHNAATTTTTKTAIPNDHMDIDSTM